MKKPYYVSVQAHTIVDDKSAAEFEFEIEATDKEVKQLFELFAEKEELESLNFRQTPIPSIPYHELDDANDAYDNSMKLIYQKIYELGTERTKRHIEKMGILEKTEA